MLSALDILYYQNGQLLFKSPPPTQVTYSSPDDASLLSVGALNGKGGFSTMRMSDLTLWTRMLSRKEVKDSYLKSKYIDKEIGFLMRLNTEKN